MPDGKVKIEITGPGAFLVFGKAAPLINEEDLRYAAEKQKTRIIERTGRGVDFEGRPFAPYSTNSPYFFYPNAQGSDKARSRSAKRLMRVVGKSYGATLTKSGKGIRFENYATFKRWLGRRGGVVDLTGPRAPHMMQSLVASVQPIGKAGMYRLVIGIYDSEKAKIAQGHNTGIPGRLPQRQFLGISKQDESDIRSDVIDHILQRWTGTAGRP